MTRKIGFLSFSLLLVTAMILSSCGTTTTTKTTNPTAITVTGSTKATTAATTQATTTAATTSTAATTTTAGAETMVDTLGKTILKPQYGGTYNFVTTSDIRGFDNAYTQPSILTSVNCTNEPLMLGDWSKGPVGTGEASFQVAGVAYLETMVGGIAESWELPDNQTMVFHIRKGIHFQNKPPVNGRELNAKDVAFSFKRCYETTGSYLNVTTLGDDRPVSITVTDDWTITIKNNPGKQGPLFIVFSGYINIFPFDGAGADGTFRDWKNSNGSGSFMITDYVPNSSATYLKNPNYWGKDPLTGMQIPYVDKLVNLVVPDMSTIIAGLQTGKVDSFLGVPWDSAEQLKITSPELKWGSYLSATTYSIAMALGKGFPWDKKEVRWALSRAIDRQKIISAFYGGNAVDFTFPIVPLPELHDMFTPLAELPQNVQDLYKYDVAAAKKLMADAGQAAGFSVEMVVSSTSQSNMDLISLVQAMWKDIGVTMTIKPIESAVYVVTGNAKSFSNMIYWYDGTSSPYKLNNWRPNNPQNASNVVSPQLVDVVNQVNTIFPFDEPNAAKLIKSQTPYILDNCWYITPPQPNLYWFAQGWVHNYNEVTSCGYYQPTNAAKYRWIDKQLKALGK